MWVVKVLIDLGVGSKVWKEYEVEVTGEVSGGCSSGTSQTQNSEFDVFLTGSRFMAFWRVTNAMSLLLPHLRDGQIGTLYFGRPRLLLERVTQDEAHHAKVMLEGAGAFVEIKPSTE
jgi:hypothetical protein